MVKMADNIMKNYSGIFMAAFALAVIFSCQKPEIDAPQAEQTQIFNKVETVLTAVLEPRTKVVLDFPALSWEDKDEIAVFDGIDPVPNKFTYEAPSVGEESAKTNPSARVSTSIPSFYGSVSEGVAESAVLYAVYPYNGSATLADGKITTTIPHEQVIPEGGNIDKSALLCVAKTTSDELAFKNVLGLVKVTVPENMKIKSIVLAGRGGETLAGTGTVEVSSVPKFEAVLPETAITLTYADGQVFPAGDYYFAVAPVKFDNGFTISFIKVDGVSADKVATQSNEIVRNGGLDTKNLLTTLTWDYSIHTKEQLFAWGRNWGRYDKVVLMADIDMEGELWTPVGDGSNWFCGEFDGNGKKIYNLNVNTGDYAGFIGHLAGKGVVKNLTIGSSDGSSYDNSSAIVHTPSKDEGGWSYVGVVAKAGDMAVIDGVRNFAKMEIPESSYNVKACMGAIAGFHAGAGEIRNCENHGAINFLASAGNTVNVIGGIVSKLDGATKIISCTNSGKITNKNTSMYYVGGIVGNTHSGSSEYAVILEKCANLGEIDILEMKTHGNDNETAVGGICGRLSGSALTQCSNAGVLSVSASSMVHVGGIAGMYRQGYGATLDRCVNGTVDMQESLFDYRATGGETRLGGVLGHCHNSSGALTLRECYNHSPMNISYAGVRQVGGICGAVADGVTLTVEGCRNTGNITLGNVASIHGSPKQIGGLFGYLKSVSADRTFEIRNSANSGNIETSISAGGETNIAGIVGYLDSYVTVSGCENTGMISAENSATKPRVGGIVGVAKLTGAKFLSCENSGSVSNASGNQNPYVGGIAGYAENVIIGDSEATGCVNRGRVSVTNAGNTGAVGGIVGNAIGGTKINHAENKGYVEWNSAKEAHVGGVVGAGANVEVSNSSNSQQVSARVTTANNARVAGIVGRSNGGVVISYCHNKDKGNVVCAEAGNTYCMGGIISSVTGNGNVIEYSSNSCAVSAECKTQNVLIGGIAGIFERGTGTNAIGNCTNSGVVTAANTKGYVYMGGIVGRVHTANVDITGCGNESSATISTIGATTTGAVYVGGIVGFSSSNAGLTGNINKGAITGEAKTSLYAGGIWGLNQALQSDCRRGNVSGNRNFGSISGKTATTNIIGGLFGQIQDIDSGNWSSDNANYGNVLTLGGALAGQNKNNPNYTMTGIVGKNVTVNGQPFVADWVEGDDTENEQKWLCPLLDNAMYFSATYVEAIQ